MQQCFVYVMCSWLEILLRRSVVKLRYHHMEKILSVNFSIIFRKSWHRISWIRTAWTWAVSPDPPRKPSVWPRTQTWTGSEKTENRGEVTVNGRWVSLSCRSSQTWRQYVKLGWEHKSWTVYVRERKREKARWKNAYRTIMEQTKIHF